MRHPASRVFLLACLGLLTACGGRTDGPLPDARLDLPGPGPSWIAGTRTEPTGGRIVVGLLLEQRDPRRLADMIPPDMLRAFLAEEEDTPVEEPVEWIDASYRTWGRVGVHLLDVARRWHREHGVEIVFREILADECADIPLVVVGARRLHRGERRALARYRERGGRLLRLGRTIVAGAQRPTHAALVQQRLDRVVADSTLLHVLPRDPLAVKARRAGDDVVLTRAAPGSRFELQDAAGRVVAEAREANDGQRLHAPDPALDPFTHHVVARWTGDGLTLTRAWSLVELVGTVDVTITASDQVQAGGVLALRVRARVQEKPAVGRSGRAALVREERVLATAHYRTDELGLAHPRLRLPADVAPGPAILRCAALEHPVVITSGLRLSVVTERPLYKQTDEVHVRLMAHRAGDGRPVAGQEVELSIGDAKRKVTTSEHGIASHTFELSDASVGGQVVHAKAGDAAASCAFRVKAFERPTFTVRAAPPALELRPGESAGVTLHAAYVNGSPLVGGSLSFDIRDVTVEETPSQFNATGRAHMVVRAGQRARSGLIHLAVQDVEGRRVDLRLPIEVQHDGPRLGVWALSDLVAGVPARFLVQSSEPGTLRLGGDVEPGQAVTIDATGRSIVTLTPMRRDRLLLRVIPAEGTALERTFKVQRPRKGGLVMGLDRRTARVGESLRIALRGEPGLAYVDVWRDATAVRTLGVLLGKGGADVELPLDASMAGVLRLFARRADLTANALRATVLVSRGRALKVAAAAQQDTYVPGATAEVDVRVHDAAGRPTAAVLGYWGVDAALLALAPPTDGHESVFDVGRAAPALEELALAAQVDGGDPVPSARLLTLFRDRGRGTPAVRKFPIRLQRTPRLEQAAKRARTQRVSASLEKLWKAYEEAWQDIAVTELVSSDSNRETLQWLARAGRIDPALLIDPWGRPFALWSDRRGIAIDWVSAGPDRAFGSADDVTVNWDGHSLYGLLPDRIRDFHLYVQEHYDPSLREKDADVVVEEPVIFDEELADAAETENDMPFGEDGGIVGAVFEGPANNGTIGLGGGAGGGFRGRGGGRDLGTGGGGRKSFGEAAVHLRADFDPTLCFVPAAVVGPDGKARLRIPLKDSMTTWRLRLVASSAAGATGVGWGSIRVKQPIHATPWLAAHLTVGDVVDVPVAIRNEEGFPVDAQVTFEAGDRLRLLTAANITVPIAAGATGRAVFRIEARRAGRAPVTIAVDTGGAKDRQQRILTVHRDARTVVAVTSGGVSADMAFPTSMPAAGPGEVRMDLYPSPLTEVLSGFDGLIRAPHG